MARFDVKIRSTGGRNTLPTLALGVASGAAASIKTGEPTKLSTLPNVILMADGDGTTSQTFTGIAAGDSTDTASAAGTVLVWLPLTGVIYDAVAKDTTAADTTAEITALGLKHVVWDGTATWSVDTAASDSASNGLTIVGGDPSNSHIYFYVMTDTAMFFAG